MHRALEEKEARIGGSGGRLACAALTACTEYRYRSDTDRIEDYSYKDQRVRLQTTAMGQQDSHLAETSVFTWKDDAPQPCPTPGEETRKSDKADKMRHSPTQSNRNTHQVVQSGNPGRPGNPGSLKKPRISRYLLSAVDLHASVSPRSGRCHRRRVSGWAGRAPWR